MHGRVYMIKNKSVYVLIAEWFSLTVYVRLHTDVEAHIHIQILYACLLTYRGHSQRRSALRSAYSPISSQHIHTHPTTYRGHFQRRNAVRTASSPISRWEWRNESRSFRRAWRRHCGAKRSAPQGRQVSTCVFVCVCVCLLVLMYVACVKVCVCVCVCVYVAVSMHV